ncbi:CRISPR-associated protein, Cas2 family [Micrococcales bacterium KH10]|nr:CRISPR-associated protein, Cas2 family [Micrococcales bacterium KH10]
MTEAGDEEVWNLVMFDLPVVTKSQQRAANQFRNMLLDLGYERVQYSIYVRYLPIPSMGASGIRMIKSNLPRGGAIRMINISDHQWSSAFRFVDAEDVSVVDTPEELTIF